MAPCAAGPTSSCSSLCMGALPGRMSAVQLKNNSSTAGEEVKVLRLNPRPPPAAEVCLKSEGRPPENCKRENRRHNGLRNGGLPLIMQRKQLLMPPLIQQVCRQPDGYSSSAGAGLDERQPHQALWLCVSVFLTPPPTSV